MERKSDSSSTFFGVVVRRQLQANGLGVCVATVEGKMGVRNVHLPPKATLTETGKQLDIWGNVHVVKEPAVVVMGDLKRDIDQGRAHAPRSERSLGYPMVP